MFHSVKTTQNVHMQTKGPEKGHSISIITVWSIFAQNVQLTKKRRLLGDCHDSWLIWSHFRRGVIGALRRVRVPWVEWVNLHVGFQTPRHIHNYNFVFNLLLDMYSVFPLCVCVTRKYSQRNAFNYMNRPCMLLASSDLIYSSLYYSGFW